MRLTSTARLVVIVMDINDNPPEFERAVYLETIPEGATIGTSLLKVHATSKDTGVNAEIAYSIVAGNDQGIFSLDQHTGEE